jgi:hypothetical protein
MTKLTRLVAVEGYASVADLLERSVCDSVCPGICTNDGCAYTTGVEPDQDRGWCEACGTNTVKSALVLAGLI